MEESKETLATIEFKRPTFLTVLCILTFLGASISLVSSMVNYFDYSSEANASTGNLLGGLRGDVNDQLSANNGALAQSFSINYEKFATVSLIQALINIPILIGALLMWKQKKTGFYVYTVFEVVELIIPLVIGLDLDILGGMISGMRLLVFYLALIMGLGDMLDAMQAGVGILFAIIFIVLYGLNLKHMA